MSALLGKLSQLEGILTSTLEELHAHLKKNNRKIDMGNTQWRSMESVKLGVPREVTNVVLQGNSRMFLDRSLEKNISKEYSDIPIISANDWYGTMGPYRDMFL